MQTPSITANPRDILAGVRFSFAETCRLLALLGEKWRAIPDAELEANQREVDATLRQITHIARRDGKQVLGSPPPSLMSDYPSDAPRVMVEKAQGQVERDWWNARKGKSDEEVAALDGTRGASVGDYCELWMAQAQLEKEDELHQLAEVAEGFAANFAWADYHTQLEISKSAVGRYHAYVERKRSIPPPPKRVSLYGVSPCPITPPAPSATAAARKSSARPLHAGKPASAIATPPIRRRRATRPSADSVTASTPRLNPAAPSAKASNKTENVGEYVGFGG